MPQEPHSDFILSDARDEWWNADFIQLMASRLKLATVGRVLDVGSGHGHWGHLWLPHLAEQARLVGVDREAQWVDEATRRSAQLGLSERTTYRQGSADDLPVADASFDMVTCQTVLMHVADPMKAISEFKRALVPGGLLLLAEPNNLASLLSFIGTQRDMSMQSTVRLVQFHLRCHRGRIALGEGDHAIGPRLSALLAEEGLVDIEVHMNDKPGTVPAAGPDTPYAQWINEQAENIERRVWLWKAEESRRLYLAGGGSESDFQGDYEQFMLDAEAFVDAVRSGTFSSGGGSTTYLVSARSTAP